MFSRIAMVVAVLAFVLGIIQFGAGIGVAAKWFTWERAFGGGNVSWAELMSQGAQALAFAVGVGTIAEIGLALQRAFPKQ